MARRSIEPDLPATRSAPAAAAARAAAPELAGLPNLGPASAAMLQAAGITSLAQLRAMGAVTAYERIRRSGARVSLNLLWALEGALIGLPWQTVARAHRTSLLLALDGVQRSGHRHSDPA